MNTLYIMAGIAGVLWIGFCSYMAYRNRENKVKFWSWVALSGAGLLLLLSSIFRAGDKKIFLKEPKDHERTVAPTEEEKKDLDSNSEELGKKATDLENKNSDLDKKAEKLDAEKKVLEDKVSETNRTLENVGTNTDSSSSRKPDPNISNRLRKG